jgi:hypothetical protein
MGRFTTHRAVFASTPQGSSSSTVNSWSVESLLQGRSGEDLQDALADADSRVFTILQISNVQTLVLG